MNEELILIKSFNPYEYQYPNRKVLTVSEIHLIKELKKRGFRVNILPDDLRQVDYIFRKGYQELFSFTLPFIITIWQELPKEIVLSTITDWYKKRFFLNDNSKPIPESVINNIVYVENFSGNMYNLNGSSLSAKDAADKLLQIEDIQKDYKQAFLQKSVYDDLPTPIYRQHSPNIIGWAKLSLDDKGLRVDKSILTDEQAWKDVKAKRLKGFSVAGIATKSTCNICNSNYVLCEHVTGSLYDNKQCHNTIEKALLAECSLVETPSNSECVVEIITNQLNSLN